MALTDIGICNRALTRLGASTISSFSEATSIAAICNQVYPSLVESELSLTPWRFAMKKVELNRLTSTPTNEWRYAYQLPTDRIGAPFAMFNSSAIGAQPVKNYEVFSDKVFSNDAALYCDYPFKPDESTFPAYFTEFIVLALASQIAIPVTDMANMADYFHTLAYGNAMDNGGGGMLAKARYADASQQPPQVLEDFTLIDVRN